MAVYSPLCVGPGRKLGYLLDIIFKKVQVGKDQEKVQSEKDSHSKNRDGKIAIDQFFFFFFFFFFFLSYFILFIFFSFIFLFLSCHLSKKFPVN